MPLALHIHGSTFTWRKFQLTSKSTTWHQNISSLVCFCSSALSIATFIFLCKLLLNTLKFYLLKVIFNFKWNCKCGWNGWSNDVRSLCAHLIVAFFWLNDNIQIKCIILVVPNEIKMQNMLYPGNISWYMTMDILYVHTRKKAWNQSEWNSGFKFDDVFVVVDGKEM